MEGIRFAGLLEYIPLFYIFKSERENCSTNWSYSEKISQTVWLIHCFCSSSPSDSPI